MKIGILTQPLHTNYGGLLQNYALQQVLKRLGHNVYTINRNSIPSVYTVSWNRKFMFWLKQIIKTCIGRTCSPFFKEFLKIRQHCATFVEKYISVTESFHNQQELQNILRKYSFDAYVVGSDQVWRPCYSENIYNDFLDFCQDERNVKRIAYAASFGVNEWEFNNAQAEECSRLAQFFNAISVREDSGIELCEKYLGVEATHVLDPTLLLEKEDYIKLVKQDNKNQIDGELFCYILDSNDKIENAINKVEELLSFKSFQIKAKNDSYRLTSNINEYIIPAPTQWVRAFMDAKMVFTDSFHGCVFSIIFNKPFWVIGNKERGNARFDSLLKLFNLENRRIDVHDIAHVDLTSTIDWTSVNTIKTEWQNKSMRFLKNNL